MKFEAINYRYAEFFAMMPPDWQEIINKIWDKVKETSTIYAIVEEGAILAGGIVFKKPLSEMTDFELKRGQQFFDLGYGYIGFLWVSENRRNEQLGSKWLSLLKKQDVKQGLWLTIEEEGLKKFYEKNGFQTIAESEDKENIEWLCVYEPEIRD
ncbi:MAG: ribosomal protein S18 acetylase RimI-like enzyme [Psychroserpens sp.]|jgi:ribosomal protein S18 acetylase RimI-like enzyme